MPGIPSATQDKILATLRNQLNAAEGSLLPPPQQNNPGRVPVVTNLRVQRVISFVGGTQFTLLFDSPISNQIDHYNIYVAGVTGNLNVLQGPSSVINSPAIVRVSTQSAEKLVFYVQTVLKSGLLSTLASSPTCTGTSIAGVAQSIVQADSTTNTANISTTNLIGALPQTGLYRLTAHIAVVVPGTVSSTLPSISVGYTDGDSAGAISGTVTNTSTGNTTSTIVTGEVILYGAISTPVTYSTSSYASSGATAMQYALHLRLEFLG